MSQPALSGPIHAVPVEPIDELTELREEVGELREQFESLQASYERDRAQWAGILHSLQAAFGGTPAQESVGGAPQPQSSAAWQMWKERLPSGCGKIIDGLLIQPLTMSQMIRACSMAYGTIKNNMSILKNNSLVEKDGERWKLKRL
jgi:hypothetical protein